MKNGGRLHHAAVFLISASGLAFQVTLTRVFAIAQWHHFAYMIISMAMLGFGVSGTLIAVFHRLIAGREQALLGWAAALLALSFPGTYAVSQSIGFETYQLTTQPIQILWLFGLTLVLSLPFFLTSTCLALAFLAYRNEIAGLYGSNMLGSGVGAGACVALFFVSFVNQVPFFLSLPAAIAAYWLIPKRSVGLSLLAVCSAVSLLGLTEIVPIRVSEYKGLTAALRLPDARIVLRRTGPQAELTVLSSTLIRETPGEIANYPMDELGPLPEQLAIFFDAGGVSVVNRTDAALNHLAFLDYVTTAAPYRLVHQPTVFVLGAGGGVEVINALTHGAVEVTAADANAQVLKLVAGELNSFSGGVYRRPEVTCVAAEGRAYLRGTRRRFDLIQIPPMDSFAAAGAGVHALAENYVYTEEALALFLESLTPDGICAITRWLKEPPRDAIKLFATAVSALERTGVRQPGAHLAMIRSWNTGTLIISRDPLTPKRIEAIRAFSASRGFDLAWLPGLRQDETNRYTVLSGFTYFEAARAILGPDRQSFFDEYPFFIAPATDDCPYFFRFFKWRSLSTILVGMGTTWIPFIEWGYITLLITLVQAFIISLTLILLPVVLKSMAEPSGHGKTGVLFYFGSLGLAFMFLEIAMIQKIVQFLTHPVYAVAVVLSSFLVFSGFGSWAAHAWRIQSRRGLIRVIVALGMVVIGELVALPAIIAGCSGLATAVRVIIVLVLLAPLGFLMGIPFPSGLQNLAKRRPQILAWAWAINGVTSVLGASLAVLLAIHFGFRNLVLAALLLYASLPLSFVTLGSTSDS